MKNTNNIKMGTYFYNDETYNFNFTTTPSASEKIDFVNSIVNTIVDTNYNSIVRNIMFDYMLIRVFSDVDVSHIQNSKDIIDAIEQFLAETNIVDIIKANMDVSLLDDLNNAVDKAIEYRTGIHPSPLNEALASFLFMLEKKIGEIDLSNVVEMVQKFTGMTDEFTPESLVNAYMNSDMHKQNIVEIKESKKSKKQSR